MFDFEKLEVYSKTKQFNSAVSLYLENPYSARLKQCNECYRQLNKGNKNFVFKICIPLYLFEKKDMQKIPLSAPSLQ